MTGRVVLSMDGSAPVAVTTGRAASEARLRGGEFVVNLVVASTRGHNAASSLLLGSASQDCVPHTQSRVMLAGADTRRSDGDLRAKLREMGAKAAT